MKKSVLFKLEILVVFLLSTYPVQAETVRKDFSVNVNLNKYKSGKKEITYTQYDEKFKKICRENGYFLGYELKDTYTITCIGDSEQVSEHQTKVAERRKERYFSLFSQIEMPARNGNKWMIPKRRLQLNEIYKTLDIEVPESAIETSLKKFQVLMNRRPKHEKLVIGCGNLVPFSEAVGDVEFIDNYGGDKFEYRHRHQHSDADTIDPDFARNPTFVGEFGQTPMHELFNGHKYKEIFIEGIVILPWDRELMGAKVLPYAVSSLIELLDDDGIVNNNSEFFSKADLVSYLETKQKSNVEQTLSDQKARVPESPDDSASINNSEFHDPLDSWVPSQVLKDKASQILENPQECHSMEDFLEMYSLKYEDLNLNSAQVKEVLNVHLWSNFEYYTLRNRLK